MSASGSPTAVLVQRLTGCCLTVALHVRGTALDDWGELCCFAEDEGTGSAAIDPTRVRRRRLPPRQPGEPGRGGAALGDRAVPSDASRSPPKVDRRPISLWLLDGTNHPGQDDLRERSPGRTRASMLSTRPFPPGSGLLRPVQVPRAGVRQDRPPRPRDDGTDPPRLGPQAQVLVDTGTTRRER